MQEQKYVQIWKKIVFNNQYVWDEQFKVVKLVLRYIFTNVSSCGVALLIFDKSFKTSTKHFVTCAYTNDQEVHLSILKSCKSL